MKKLVALLLALVLCFALCACGKGGNEGGGSQAGSAAFVKPENYASVLVVSINPEIRLYLDKDNNVLAVEPVNDDAKAVVQKLDVKNKKIDAAVKSIITVSKDEGFVKEGVTVSIKVAEVKDKEISADTIADLAKQSTNETLTELKITAEVKTEKFGYTHSDPINSDPANSQHHHEFSKATCTEPAKCACGETQGKTAPHNYVSGACTVCKSADPHYVSSFTSVKEKAGTWNLTYAAKNKLYVASLILYGNDENLRTKAKIGDALTTLPEEVWEDIRGSAEYAKFNNKEYYMANGENAPLVQVNENKTSLILVDGNGKKMILERKNETTLVIKSVENGFIAFENAPAGSILTFSAN